MFDQKAAAKINDRLRTSMAVGQIQIKFSSLVESAPDRANIVKAVQKFKTFDPQIDVTSEHKIGMVEVGGIKYLFTIKYLDDRYEYDREIGSRELSIMRLSEYRSTKTPTKLRGLIAADGP